MSAHRFGSDFTIYLGSAGAGKIMADSSGVLQIAGKCGGYAELPAGTYTIQTLDSGQHFFYFWVGATGAATITGVGTFENDEVSLVVREPAGGWRVVTIPASQPTLQGFIDLPLATWREVTSNDISNVAANGGVLATDSTPTLEYIDGNTNSALQILWAADGVDPIATQVTLPPDVDITQQVYLNVRSIMSGEQAGTLTVDVFVGHEDNIVEFTISGIDDAVDTHQGTILAADLGTVPVTLAIEMTPGAHDTDTLTVYSTYLTYTKKVTF